MITEVERIEYRVTFEFREPLSRVNEGLIASYMAKYMNDIDLDSYELVVYDFYDESAAEAFECGFKKKFSNLIK